MTLRPHAPEPAEQPASAPPPLPEWVRRLLPEEMAARADEIASLMRREEEILSAEALHGATATRLSFANTLMDRMIRNRWSISLRECEVTPETTGYLAYELEVEGRSFGFGVFAYTPAPPDHVSLFRDTTTDFLGVLVEGPLDRERMERDRAQFDEALWRGRTDERVYGWTIARRSRVFGPVVDCLSEGRQPDRQLLLESGGYLVRNGGYYGNGRMGTAAWASYAEPEGPLSTPYYIDLLCLYLWRVASLDFADAAARARSASAVRLDDRLRRYFGIGNSSGLGTIAALVRWPIRLSSAVLAREVAFAYVKSLEGPPGEKEVAKLARLLGRARDSYAAAQDPGPELVEPRLEVAAALDAMVKETEALDWAEAGERPWLALVEKAARHGSREAVEILHALLLELHPEVDALNEIVRQGPRRPVEVAPEMTMRELVALIEDRFSWALEVDFSAPGARQFFWYRSEENGENRRGERPLDLGVERETFVDVAGLVRRLYDFASSHKARTVGEFLLEEPEQTLAVSRVQLAEESPYSELHADLIGARFRASDGIRLFLTLLGLELPTPATARWVRGVFFRGAPLPDEVAAGEGSEWIFPKLPALEEGAPPQRCESVGA